MTSLKHRRHAGFIGILCAAALLGCASAHAVDLEREIRFDIPAGKLADALIKFSKQAQVQVLTSGETTAAAKTDGVSGSASMRTALTRLLKSSGLGFKVMTENSIAIGPAETSKPAGAAQAPIADAGMHLARVDVDPTQARKTEDEAQSTAAAVKDNDTESPELTVTGSRIRGQAGEQTIQPVLTITAEDIERYGVSSLGEVLRHIPQATNVEEGRLIQPYDVIGLPDLDVTTNRVTATLRGAPLGGTLLLVNGRRVAKNGQAGGFQGNDAYDIGGIPLSAVERIDVLLDGASAIYGADAVGGVINVILKKGYSGTEARVSYDNTFDTDAGVRTASLTHGFAVGRLSGMVTGSWEKANALSWKDRWFLQTFDRRSFGPNGYDYRSPGTYEGRGVVTSLSGNLPGLSTNVAAIPVGSTGQNLTVADYANAGPLPELFDYGHYLMYSTPYERKELVGNAQYEFSRALTAFAEVQWSDNRNWSRSIPIAASTIVPAGAPGNPFGVDIRVRKFFFDLDTPETEAATQNQGLTAGLRGGFAGDWRYEAAAHEARTRPDVGRHSASLKSAAVAAAFAGPNPPVLLYDSTDGISPNPAGTVEALTNGLIPDAERSRTRSYDAQTDGPLFALPGGEVRASFGMEYRDEYSNFPLPEQSLSIQSFDRHTSGYFAEVRVPLIGERQGVPLVNRLEVNLAARYDRYSDFPDSTSPRFGLMYRPVSWLMLRASSGKGYKVPTLVQLFQPEVEGGGYGEFGTDPLRGDELIVSPDDGLPIIFRGNPGLHPERSKNFTGGAVLNLPVKGLSLSLDYYDSKYIDRVGSLDLVTRILLYPDTVMRGPNLPGDQPGWPGPVIGYEDIAVNIAYNRIAGYDVGLNYDLSSALGEWNMKIDATKTTRNEIRSIANQPPTYYDELSSTTFSFPVQLSGRVFWTRGPLTLGALATYREAAHGYSLVGTTTPSAIRWDLQGGYDFAQSAVQGVHSWWGHALAGTRVNLTIFNLFNVDPPLDSSSSMPDSTVIDARLRRYSINLIKQF